MNLADTKTTHVCTYLINNHCGILLLACVAAVCLPAIACDNVWSVPLYIKSPRRGFYCDNNSSTVLQGLDVNQCQLYCLDRGPCAGVSYSLVSGICIITPEHCLVVPLHPDYEIILFQPTQHYSCISWLNYHPARYITRGNQGVARKMHENQLIPGKFAYNARVACIIWDSSEHCSRQGGEYPQVGDHCSVAWVPYTAGDPIMEGAVQGGALSDGTPLYVVNLHLKAEWGENGWAFGYYRPDTGLGYAGLHGAQTKVDMEMLIVVW